MLHNKISNPQKSASTEKYIRSNQDLKSQVSNEKSVLKDF